MRRRRTLIIAFVLTASLALGIGYAAVSDSLSITGEVSATKQEFNVVFTDYDEVSASNDATSSTGDLEKKDIEYSIENMKYEGDTVVGTFTIQNKNEFKMYLQNPVIKYGDTEGDINANDPDMFTVTYVWDEPSVLTEGLTAKTGTTTITVTVTLNQASPDDTTTKYFKLTIPASSTAPAPAP